MSIGLFIWAVVVAYFLGSMAWNHRAFQLYEQRVSKPWQDAINQRDWDAVDQWHAMADDFPLQDARYMFNPIRWVLNWHWTPPARSAKKGAA